MMKVHFLNVGHGDCTIIEHPTGRLTVIDINNGTDVDEASGDELASFFASTRTDALSKALPALVNQAQALSQNQMQFLAKAGYDVRLTNPIEYLRTLRADKSIFRYIQSHPDLDHMRGLVALRGNGFSIGNFWDTTHDKDPAFGGPLAEWDNAEWTEYQDLRTGTRGTPCSDTSAVRRASTTTGSRKVFPQAMGSAFWLQRLPWPPRQTPRATRTT
jgi:hypothetical protein